MTTYIALFRGINVGGHNILPMKKLSAMLERCGHTNVRTYIQSGNVVFTSSSTNASALSKDIAAAVRKAHGFEPRVMVLTLSMLKKIAAANPFRDAEDDPQRVHVFFLSEAAKDANLTAMEAMKAKRERFALKGAAFYLHTPDGFGRSKLAASVERHLGVAATGRNWRTVTTLVALAESDG